MAFRGAGSALQRSNSDSPETFTDVPNVINVGGPEQVNDEIEVTDLGSTAREFIAALKDNGSVTFEAHFDTSNAIHQGLYTDVAAGTIKNWRIVWNDPANSPNPYVQFPAFISSLSNDTPPNESVKINGTLRITGAITTSW